MPTFDFFFWDQSLKTETLTGVGPIIQVEVSMPTALSEFYTQKNIPIPNQVTGYALIDTGASITSIDETILQQLSILPIDSIPCSTPSGPGRNFVYPTKLTFPALNIKDFSLARVIGCNLKWKTEDGKEIIMLLGRDLLRGTVMIYNGKSSMVTLAF